MKNLLTLLILIPLFVFTAQAGDKAEVMKVSRQAVLALKNKNMATLAALTHPAKGVRFSSYSYVDKSVDLVFKREQVSGLWANPKIYKWGEFDGSGDPIKMRFSKYYARFVYDRDFANAPDISYNDQLGGGNTIVNVRAAYPKGKFVEYHFPESTDRNEMGWESLRLIFERTGKKWYLVGICHDEWTI
jgi:hypothetical protein